MEHRVENGCYSPESSHAVCGWVSRPGELIPCEHPQRGPFYCPQCGEQLAPA